MDAALAPLVRRRNRTSSCSAVSACCIGPSCCTSTAPGRRPLTRPASARLAGRDRPPEPEAGEALYQQAELHRLPGESPSAEDAYREASRAGRQPEPGSGTASTGAGRVDRGGRCAPAGARRDPRPGSATAPAGRVRRGRCSRPATSRRPVPPPTSWRRSPRRLGAPMLRALAARAEGAVLLAEGDAQALARRPAPRVRARGRRVDAPYEAARAGAHRAILPGARRRGHGADGVRGRRRGLPGARARPAMARLDALDAAGGAPAPGGLTGA